MGVGAGPGTMNGDPSVSCDVACDVVFQLVPSQPSKVSPTQYDGRWARTRMTTVSPSPPRSAVSSRLAKPR
jgi:hypothetical protein